MKDRFVKISKNASHDGWLPSGVNEHEFCKDLRVEGTNFANRVSPNKSKKSVENFVKVTTTSATNSSLVDIANSL